MTDAARNAGSFARGARGAASKKPMPIVPSDSVAGRAMVLVIAIMTFLSCLTLGAVSLVRDTASVWQTQIAREATIQIRPSEGLDMNEALATASQIAAGYSGIAGVSIVDEEATKRLLEPWLGAGADLEALPVPRLLIITLDPRTRPDFAALRAELEEGVPGATLDDHRTWVDRLVSMARATVTIGLATLALMLAATALTVVFAARGAMAGNGHVIEVLHFVGAEAPFIASQFRRHFLFAGVKGAASGGIAAIFVFVIFYWWSLRNMATPQADQATALFGNFAIGLSGYFGVGLVVAVVAILTAATSHITVLAYLRQVDAGHLDGL